jgi:PPP family 3-phenylpropionic acid transporter
MSSRLPAAQSPVPGAAWSRQNFPFALFLFAYYGYIGVFSPYASLFFAHKGMSAPQIGVLMSMMQVMRIFGPAAWGWLADRSRRRVLVLRMAAAGALAACCGLLFGHGFVWFFAVMVTINTFTSAQGPLSEALMLSAMRGDLTYYGKLRLWGSVGFIAAVTAAGELLDRFGIVNMPWVALGLLFMVLYASLCMRETPYGEPDKDAPSVAQLMARPEVMAFFTSTFLMIGAHAALYVFYSLYLSRLGYSNTVIGMMWSLGVLAEIAFFYYQAPIFRRLGVRTLMLGCLLVAVARFLLIGLYAESLLLLVLAQVLHAATFGTHHSASVAMLQRWFGGPLQAQGQALYISISYGLGGTLGGLALSAAWDAFGPRSVFIFAAAASLAATGAAALCYRWLSQADGGGETGR